MIVSGQFTLEPLQKHLSDAWETPSPLLPGVVSSGQAPRVWGSFAHVASLEIAE